MPVTQVASRTLEIAREYLKMGLSPIPDCGPDHNCDSPGKTPHLSGWSRYSETPPTDSELIRLFQHHRGNIGIAVGPGQIVLDIDARSGGIESLEMLQAIHGELPDTPIVETGGGGLHYYMTVSKDFNLKAGGSLTAVGAPGVEWKGSRGHVVAPPSMHVSGKPYVFQFESTPRTSPMAPAPQWILDLITQAQIHDSGGTRKKADGSRAPLPQDEVIFAFKRSYSEGERRVASGLPKIVGLLISRKVPLDQALVFLEEWQSDHFLPPLEDTHLSDQVTSMYQRYGHPPDGSDAAGEAFLRWLTKRMLHTPNGHPTIEDGKSDEERETKKRREISQMRNAKQAEVRQQGFEWWSGQPNVDSTTGLTFPISSSGESKARFMANAPNFNTPDPRLIPSKEELINLIGDADDKKLLDISQCLWNANGDCIVHGTRLTTRKTCKLTCHYGCPTKTGGKIRQLDLPDLGEDDGIYRNVRLRWGVSVEGLTSQEIEDTFEMERTDLAHRVHVISKRKAIKGQFLHWSMAIVLNRPEIIFEARMFFHQTDEESVNKAIEEVRGRLEAVIWKEAVFKDGESAVVQLYEDVSATLIGMTNKNDFELFRAYYWGTKGKTMAQGLDTLWKMLRDVVTDEVPRCDVPGCGRRLRIHPISPEEEAAEAARKEAENGYKPPPSTVPMLPDF